MCVMVLPVCVVTKTRRSVWPGRSENYVKQKKIP